MAATRGASAGGTASRLPKWRRSWRSSSLCRLGSRDCASATSGSSLRERRDGHGLVVQLAVGVGRCGADLAVGVEAGHRRLRPEDVLHGLQLLLDALLEDELASDAADEEGELRRLLQAGPLRGAVRAVDEAVEVR